MKILFKIIIGIGLLTIGIFYNLNDLLASVLNDLVLINGNESDLRLTDYELIEYNVKFKENGVYEALYLDKDGNTIKRKIIVSNEEELMNNGYVTENIKYSIYIDYDEVIDCLIVDNRYYFLVKLNNQYYLESWNPSGTTYQYKINVNSDYALSKLLYNDDEQYFMIGGIYFDGTNTDLCLVNISIQGIIRRIYYYGGNNNDYLTGALSDDNFIYLFGTSLSNDFISNIDQKENSFLLKIKWQTKQVFDTENLGLKGIDEIKWGGFNNDNIVLVQSYFQNDYCLNKIIIFDNQIIEYNLPLIGPINNVLLSSYLDDIYIAFKYTDEFNQIHQMIYQISNNQLLLIDDTLTSLIPKALIVNEKGIQLLEMDNLGNYQYNIINNNKKINYQGATIEKALVLNDYFKNDDFILISDHIEIVSLDNIYMIESHHIVNNELQLPVIYNGYYELTNHNNIECDLDCFGNYEIEYRYQTDNISLINHQTLKVPLHTNLYDGVYAAGSVIYFNGEGLIDNQKINSGYQLNKVGDYQIFLIGHNEVVAKKIKVVNLDYNKNQDLAKDHIWMNVENSEHDTIKMMIENNQISVNISEKDYLKQLWYLLIPIGSLGVIASLYCFIGRKWL